MLPTRLGINAIDIAQWLDSPAVKERLEAVHLAHVDESLKLFGILDLPRSLTVAFEAAELVARRDTIAIVTAIIHRNNEILAGQLEQLGIDTTSVSAPSASP